MKRSFFGVLSLFFLFYHLSVEYCLVPLTPREDEMKHNCFSLLFWLPQQFLFDSPLHYQRLILPVQYLTPLLWCSPDKHQRGNISLARARRIRLAQKLILWHFRLIGCIFGGYLTHGPHIGNINACLPGSFFDTNGWSIKVFPWR